MWSSILSIIGGVFIFNGLYQAGKWSERKRMLDIIENPNMPDEIKVEARNHMSKYKLVIEEDSDPDINNSGKHN
tara:strand:- start:4770 stop:4991 length:222 start_codon:yes stop_codon:yes gene_type:complete